MSDKPKKEKEAGTPPFLFGSFDSVTHLKTGGVYVICGLPSEYVIETTSEPAYVYYKEGGQKKYVRSQAKMEDGRFVKVKPPPIPEEW